MNKKGTIYRRKFNFEKEVVLTRKFHSATQNWINHSLTQMKFAATADPLFVMLWGLISQCH
jgi:hypothetical protein